jgi:hypothetical protein
LPMRTFWTCKGAEIACVAVFEYGFVAKKADLMPSAVFFGGFSLTLFSSVCARAATAF